MSAEGLSVGMVMRRHCRMVALAFIDDLASFPRCPTHSTLRSSMILKMCVALSVGRCYKVVFLMVACRCTKVSRQKRCCRSGGGRMRSTRCAPSPHLISLDCLDFLPDGYIQDPYTRCKGLSEIAPQVNRYCPPVGALC